MVSSIVCGRMLYVAENDKIVINVKKTRKMIMCTSRICRKLKSQHLTDVQIKEVRAMKSQNPK